MRPVESGGDTCGTTRPPRRLVRGKGVPRTLAAQPRTGRKGPRCAHRRSGQPPQQPPLEQQSGAQHAGGSQQQHPPPSAPAPLGCRAENQGAKGRRKAIRYFMAVRSLRVRDAGASRSAGAPRGGGEPSPGRRPDVRARPQPCTVTTLFDLVARRRAQREPTDEAEPAARCSKGLPAGRTRPPTPAPPALRERTESFLRPGMARPNRRARRHAARSRATPPQPATRSTVPCSSSNRIRRSSAWSGRCTCRGMRIGSASAQ